MIVIPFAVPGLLTRVLRTHLGLSILLGAGLLTALVVLLTLAALLTVALLAIM